MKAGLLAHPPTPSELERLYVELARLGAPALGRHRPWPYRPASAEERVALAGEMLRYDPRLLGILVQLFLARWEALDPLALRRAMARMRWPQALAVACAFARLASSDPEQRRWLDYVGGGWSAVAAAERFFFDAERPGSRTAARKLGRNLAPYARWGFVGTERPVVDAASKRTVGRYDAPTRRRLLAELCSARKEFALADYLDAVDGAVSRQQALRDLRSFPGVAPTGRGRGARWRVVGSRHSRALARPA